MNDSVCEINALFIQIFFLLNVFLLNVLISSWTLGTFLVSDHRVALSYVKYTDGEGSDIRVTFGGLLAFYKIDESKFHFS